MYFSLAYTNNSPHRRQTKKIRRKTLLHTHKHAHKWRGNGRQMRKKGSETAKDFWNWGLGNITNASMSVRGVPSLAMVDNPVWNSWGRNKTPPCAENEGKKKNYPTRGERKKKLKERERGEGETRRSWRREEPCHDVLLRKYQAVYRRDGKDGGRDLTRG